MSSIYYEDGGTKERHEKKKWKKIKGKRKVTTYLEQFCLGPVLRVTEKRMLPTRVL